MTSIKTLVAAGLLLAVTSAALADPAIKLLPAGSKGGSIVVQGIMNGGSLSAVELHIKFDPTQVTVANTSASFVPNAAGGWASNGFNVVNGNEIQWVASNGNGQTTDGPIGTISFTATGSGKATLLKASNWADTNFGSFAYTTDVDSAVVNGAVRDLGAPIIGAPSTGPGKVVAVAAGTSLHLLKGSDLTDVAGFTAPTVGPVSGRPAFGMIGPLAVLAVGDDAGKLTVVDAATGAAVGTQVTLAGKVSTPAIAVDAIYAAVTPATGKATVVKVIAGVATPVATLEGSTVTGAPAVSLTGFIAVGTDAGLEVLRADGTHQATVGTSATVAPIIGASGMGLSANATNVLGFNAVTGSATGAPAAHGAGAVSEAWLEGNTVTFGTASGKILSVDLTSGAPTLAATALTTGAVSAQPIIINGVTYVIDATGNLASTAGLSAPLGAAGAKALAATGRDVTTVTPAHTGTDSIIAATATGVVAAVAL